MPMRRTLVVRLALLTPSIALAHVGVGDTSGVAHGFMLPVSGLDHVLAMVAVGMFAAPLGGRALWLVPLAFMTMMALGGTLGIPGVGMPYLELGIGLSVVMLGAALALALAPPLAVAMALAGLFAIFHGMAHGAEMPVTASAWHTGSASSPRQRCGMPSALRSACLPRASGGSANLPEARWRLRALASSAG
jgi:urease accessory protein